MTPSFTDAAATPDGSDASTREVTAAMKGVVAIRDIGTVDPETGVDSEPEEAEVTVKELFEIAKRSEAQSITYMQTSVRPRWTRALKAFHNEHFEGSKYNSDQWKGRSKLFRPKTRSAVRKAMTNAAKALFGPGDVVAVVPQNEGDPVQTASAAIKQELLNYRLSRTTKKNGIRWFQITMGARQDSMLCGVCISKQVWRYRQEIVTDKQTGLETANIIEDKPDVVLYAPENVMFSPTCDWTDPAQSSEYLILRHPMSITDAMGMIRSNSKKAEGLKFDDIDEAKLRTYATGSGAGPSDTIGPRTARNDGTDPLQRTTSANPVIWMDEVFIKHNGQDMVFWKLGTVCTISNAVKTADEYPAFGGARPVVIGFGSLEPHRPYPMSAVESWQQIQQEINDGVNLRLDHMKQVVTPLAKVKRGQKVDLKQVQSRGSNSNIVMLNNMEDVDWASIPDVPQSAFVENNYLNADFDDLSGSFNTGTVQTNRSLNETVGGMKLLASDANAVGEFDLSVWVETWVEPVVWQLLKLEEYYESDEMVLAIAGQKAKLYERFGTTEITDTLLQAETNLTVKIGMGVSNLPQERLQKFMMASKTLGEILAPFVSSGVVKMPVPKVKELTNTVFGDAGIPDASERFFIGMNDAEPQQPEQQGPSPEQQAAMAEAQAKQQAAEAKAQMELQAHEQSMAHEERKTVALENKIQNEIQRANEEHVANLDIKAMAAGAKLKESQIGLELKSAKAQFDTKQSQIKASSAPSEPEPPAPPPPPDPQLVAILQMLGGTVNNISEVMSQITSGQQQTQEMIERLGQMLTAPKKLIRGADGRASGVETVLK